MCKCLLALYYSKILLYSVETGNYIQSTDDLENLVVGINQQQPVYLKQIAKKLLKVLKPLINM